MISAEAGDLVAAVLPVVREQAARSDLDATFPASSLAALQQAGLMSLLVPESYGGAGGSLRAFVDIAQELAGACLSTAQIWAMHTSHVDAIVQYGTSELKAELLPRLVRDQLFIASVTSEKGRGASLFSAHSPLLPNGDRTKLDRSAPVVTGGAHADGYLISMRATPEASSNEVSLVYADRSDLTVEATGEWNTLGMRATESIGLQLQGEIPNHNLVGEAGNFAEVARENMIPMSHLGWSACWLGAARGAFSGLVRWYAASDSDGSDLFHERLARIRLDLELVSAYLTRVQEEVTDSRAHGRSLSNPRAQLQLNALKISASDLTFRAVDNMIQLAGLRLGYMRNAPVALERTFRDLRSASLTHANDGMRVGVGALSLLDRSVNLI